MTHDEQFRQLQHLIESSSELLSNVSAMVNQSVQSIAAQVSVQEEAFRTALTAIPPIDMQTVSSIAESYTQQIKQAAYFSNQIVENAYQDIVRQEELAEASRRFDEKYKTYVGILASVGWPPMMELPVSAIRQLVDDYNEDSAAFYAEVDAAIVHFHDDDVLRSILRRWENSALTTDRHQILSDAVDAHLSGKYNLSIPATLAQIEGVVATAHRHQGRMSGASLRRYVDSILEIDASHLPLRSVILDGIYARFYWGDSEVPSLSRHAILHGACIQYGTVENSLRVILLLDLFVCMLDRKARRGRQV